MSIVFSELPLDLQQIINAYFPPQSEARSYYLTHVMKVTGLAFDIIERKKMNEIDQNLVLYGGMLHDIGIVHTHAPQIGCNGNHPYIAHNYLGRKMMEEEGLHKVALICERHIGVGLTKKEIIQHNLPVPQRDMLPLSLEEKLICYADKFYSKSKKHLTSPKPKEKIRKNIAKFGRENLMRWEQLEQIFGNDDKFEHI
jgi:uncharacterized protein